VKAIDSTAIDSTVRNMQTTTRNLTTLTSNLDSTSRKLNAVMTQLQTGDGTAAKFLNDPGVYNNLRELLGRMDSLVTDIKANPKRYINVKVF
jgi:phospholipid/cholesterol/gamma-HCH transport system substrate-binding protein